MNNKKLQQFIERMQAKNEPSSAEAAAAETQNPIALNGQSVAPLSAANYENYDIVSYPNDYFTIETVNGEDFDQGQRIGLEQDDFFTVKVDYEKVISDYGPHVVLRFMGITKMYHIEYSLYSLNDGALIGNYECQYEGGSFYDVQLDEVYAKTGSADFIFKADWEGTEAIALNACRMYSGINLRLNPVISLNVATQPTKKSYKEGEVFNRNGMVVVATHKDGFTEEITDYTISPIGKITSNVKNIEISYAGAKCRQPITVIGLSSISVKTAPMKTVYNENEVFNPTGMKVAVTYKDGTTAEITGYTYTPTGKLSVANKVIKISYMSVSCTLPITVRGFSYIYVSTLPAKTYYLSGDTFDPAGMEVKAVYTNGEECTVTGYTLSGTKLTLTEKTVTISYKGKTTTLKVEVSGQRVDVSAYWETKSSGSSSWIRDSKTSNVIYCNTANGVETRTVVKIPRGTINFCGYETVNIKMKLTANTRNAYPVCKPSDKLEFNVNGQIYFKKSNYLNVIVDLGIFESSEIGDIEILFKRYGNAYSFEAKGENAPVFYVSRVNSIGTQNTVKEFPLIGGAKLAVDLYNGKSKYTFDLIAPEKSLLGYGISYIHKEDPIILLNGSNIRLNLHEKLVCIVNDKNKSKSYVYTDPSGNNYGFNTVIYCYKEHGKYFLTEDDIDKLYPSSGGFLFEGSSVKIEYQTVGNQYLLTEAPYAVTETAYYKNLSDKSKEGLLWLKCNGLTKTFNAGGNLIMVNDEYGNYFTIKYDLLDTISQVTDCNGKVIQFEYDGIKLISITDSRGRLIELEYAPIFIATQKDNLKPVAITTADGTIGISYNIDDTISSLTSSDGYGCNIKYVGFNGVKSITQYTTLDKVPDGVLLQTEISRLDFDYNVNNGTIITDSDANKLIYKFNDKGENTEYYEVVANVVTAAEKYEYTANESFKKIKADVSTLYITPFSSYKFVDGETSTTYLDEYNNAKSVLTENIKLTDDYSKSTETVYHYDDNHRLHYTVITDTYGDETILYERACGFDEQYVQPYGITVAVTKDEITENQYSKLYYDGKGNLIESRVEFEGYEVGSHENFISEFAFDENRRLTEKKDERGLYSVNYAYKEGTELIDKISLPIGGGYEFAYDTRDRITKKWMTDNSIKNTNTVEYDKDMVTTLNHSGNVPISFEYDAKRRLSKVYLNGELYESYEYEDNVADGNYTVDKVTRTNANGDVVTVVTDKLQGFRKVLYNNATIYVYSYNFDSNVATERDHLTRRTNQIKYDTCGNLKSVNGTVAKESYSYDSHGRLKNDNGCTYSYGGKINEYISEAKTGPFTVTPKVDVNGRYIGKTVECNGTTVLDESVEYLKSGYNATHIPNCINYGDGKLNYVYDDRGNITTVMKNGEIFGDVVTIYTNDMFGRLSMESNKKLNKNYYYSYDNNGNIISREETEYKSSGHMLGTGTVFKYTYDENGRMTSYNGETCEYDNMGNPTLYRGKEAIWKYGRRLMKLGDNTFSYDALGTRTKKNTIGYLYDSKGRLIKQNDGLEFFYDNYGLIGFSYNSAYYVYRKDIQGNITAVLDSTGKVVVEYDYDAWGNHTVSGSNTELGNLNPFRYRGYYYDIETGLYYLQTRYYDPETGRFLNMDSLDYADPDTINGLNLYSYCNNNPVMNVDPTGHLFFTIFLIGLIAGAVIGAAANGVEAYKDGARGWDLFGAIAMGAVVGGAIGAVAGAVVGAGVAIIGAGASAIGAGMGGFALTSGGMLSGGALVAAGAGAVVAGSALVAGGVVGGALGLNVLFASYNRPNNNVTQNKQFKDAAREAGVDVNDPNVWDDLNEVHRYIRKNKLNLGYKDLVKLIRDFFG